MSQRIPCEMVEVGTAEYLDDDLPPDLLPRFEAHLDTCWECRTRLYRMIWVIDSLSALPSESIPHHLKERLLAAARTRVLQGTASTTQTASCRSNSGDG